MTGYFFKSSSTAKVLMQSNQRVGVLVYSGYSNKHHWLGGLNNRDSFLRVLEAISAR